MASADVPLRVAFLGCGFISTAILKGLLRDPASSPALKYTACVRSQESVMRLERELASYDTKVEIIRGDITGAADKAQVVVIGCAPYDLKLMLETPGLKASLRNKIIVSVLAGTSSEQVIDVLADDNSETRPDFHVVQVIPTIGAADGDSVSLIASSPSLDEEQKTTVESVFKRVGVVQHVEAESMNDATAVGAACHALAILAVDAITDAAVAEGVERSVALPIAAQCFRAVSGLMSRGMTPEQVKVAMSTPKGITMNSLLQLRKGGAPATFADTVRLAINHTRNMSG